MKIIVLLVMAGERRRPLLERLGSPEIEVWPVSDCEEAQRVLETRPPVQVVLTDETLSDGNWARVMRHVWENQVEAQTIVCTRLVDPRLWVHVLAHGAYDLLVEPHEKEEVRRIIESAAAENADRLPAAG